MRAADLAEQIPTVGRGTSAAEAVRILAEYRLPGLVVANDAGVPIAVVPGSQLLGVVLPRYVVEDPKLAHVFGEDDADRLCANLAQTTVGELLDAQQIVAAKLPSVLPDDTLIEIAAVMVAAHTPLIIVRDREKNYSGAVLLSRMLAAVASAAGEDSELMRKRLHRDLIPNAAAEGDLIPNAAAEGDRQPNAGADSDPRS
jgi:CBS domain-containing protein